MADPCSTSSEAVLKTEDTAIEMYRFAALMLGSETEALHLVESAVASVDVDPCADPTVAKGLVRERVLHGALTLLHGHDPASFSDVPAAGPSSCLDEDDSAPSDPELADLVSGAGRDRLREWLNRLSAAQRAVFVQRTVLRQDNAATAGAMNRVARPAVWTPDAIALLFRQAICSLASSLAHAVPAQA